jgi:hypothetical protein
VLATEPHPSLTRHSGSLQKQFAELGRQGCGVRLGGFHNPDPIFWDRSRALGRSMPQVSSSVPFRAPQSQSRKWGHLKLWMEKHREKLFPPSPQRHLLGRPARNSGRT